jgi:hypothetical protein
MKCFTLSSYGAFIDPTDQAERTGTLGQFSDFPQAKRGLRYDLRWRSINVGGDLIVPVSEELLNHPNPNFVRRRGFFVTILRAGIKGDSLENLELVPESAEDENQALVALDLWGKPNIRYETQEPNRLAAVYPQSDLGATKEMALAVLSPFKPLVAVRSGKRWRRNGWRFYREPFEEKFGIKSDGLSLFYEV